ncbi:BON domain-containing protein [Psychromonas sp. RZ22]|uniref:BON domain-containing protein n=1 Tax=Psychromonas algarum TaxID=2555643 RepID=UPI0010685F4B|nr:BON domain-containing protein [Psychromonas sp. RZ22]TEW54893.1 BON domain-containing protein [Psychromonas sp. RZ22]
MKATRIILPLLLSLLLQGCASGLIVAAGAAVTVSSDERSVSQQVHDDNLSVKAIDTVVALDSYNNKNIRINIVTNNGYILLIGQVNDQATSNKIENALSQLKETKGVYNQLRIGSPIGVLQQTKDSWLTTKVKTQLTSHDKVNPLKIKVVTENSEVFLIGQVTQEMSNYATNITRNIDGVKQVIRVFEIIPPKPSKAVNK